MSFRSQDTGPLTLVPSLVPPSENCETRAVFCCNRAPSNRQLFPACHVGLNLFRCKYLQGNIFLNFTRSTEFSVTAIHSTTARG
jgi:hypothetical protein